MDDSKKLPILKELASEYLNKPDFIIKKNIIERLGITNVANHLSIIKIFQENLEYERNEKEKSYDDPLLYETELSSYKDKMITTILDKVRILHNPRGLTTEDLLSQYLISHCYNRRPTDSLTGILIMGPPNTGKSTLIQSLPAYYVPFNTLGISRWVSNLSNYVLEDWPIGALNDCCNDYVLRQLLLGQQTSDKSAGSVTSIGPKWVWMTTNDDMKEFEKLPIAVQRRWTVITISLEQADINEQEHLTCDFEEYRRSIEINLKCYANYVDAKDKKQFIRYKRYIKRH